MVKTKNDKRTTTILKILHRKPNTLPRSRATEWKRSSTCFLLFVYVYIADEEPIISEGAPLTGLRPHLFCAGHKPATSWVVALCFMFNVFRWDVVVSFC